jgi:hypothetical protein
VLDFVLEVGGNEVMGSGFPDSLGGILSVQFFEQEMEFTFQLFADFSFDFFR